jgi:hypothetical protein
MPERAVRNGSVMDLARNRPDLAGAVERSRAARAARRRRRRRVIAFAFASILLGGGTALSIAGLDPGAAVDAAVGRAKGLAELLDQRSPGERTSAELTKLKRAQRASAKQRMAAPPKAEEHSLAPPVESALAKVLLPPPMAVDTLAPGLDASLPPTLENILNPSPGGSTFPSPGGADLTPPGGAENPPGDDTLVSFPKDEPKEIVPVTPLPEPGTWATMLLGFGLIGWRVRRQARGAAKLRPA